MHRSRNVLFVVCTLQAHSMCWPILTCHHYSQAYRLHRDLISTYYYVTEEKFNELCFVQEYVCADDEYYDGLMVQCVPCTEICRPPLDFCRINCLGLISNESLRLSRSYFRTIATDAPVA